MPKFPHNIGFQEKRHFYHADEKIKKIDMDQ
jgi:hypothetical protein